MNKLRNFYGQATVTRRCLGAVAAGSVSHASLKRDEAPQNMLGFTGPHKAQGHAGTR